MTRVAPEDRGAAEPWMLLLCLDSFHLSGDDVSEYLFGLSKSPDGAGLFVGRGLPTDCSEVVRSEVVANAEFTHSHGDGNFGHTFATFDEVRAALAAAEAPSLVDSEWAHALAAAEFASHAPGVSTTTYCRAIVWANW